ncbi:hypothetical protein GQ457_15G026600 [Hibiscus cannabinus]
MDFYGVISLLSLLLIASCVSNMEACHHDIDCQYICPNSGFCNMATHQCECKPMSEQLSSNVVSSADVSDAIACHSDMQCVSNTKACHSDDECMRSCPRGGFCNSITHSCFCNFVSEKLSSNVALSADVSDGIACHSVDECMRSCPRGGFCNSITHSCLCNFKSEKLSSNVASSADVSDAIACHSDMQCQFTCPHSGFCNMVTHKCACNPKSKQLPSN